MKYKHLTLCEFVNENKKIIFLFRLSNYYKKTICSTTLILRRLFNYINLFHTYILKYILILLMILVFFVPIIYYQ